MDDFGTGYFFFSYFDTCDIDTIKIGRSFASRMVLNSKTSAIVQMFDTLGREMGLDIVAEGVESYERLDLLRHFGFGTPQKPDAALC